jgi:hypothetical protein
MSKVYISSTYEDLRSCREKVDQTLSQLDHAVVAMEDYVARDQRPQEKCIADVAASDFYVGIVAWRYGFVPGEGNPEERSITELEYRAAGTAGVPRLMFLVADTAAWPVDHVDIGPARERVERFRGEVKEAHMVTFFSTCDELPASVAVAVQRAKEEVEEEKVERERKSYMDKHSWFASLMNAVQAAPQDRKAALLEWVERHGASVVQVFGNQLADRYRRRIAKKRDRERQQRLERAVQQAVRDALHEEPPRPERRPARGR